MIESWKQSVLAVMGMLAAVVIAVGLQAWSVADTATKQPPIVIWEKSGSPLSFSTPEAALAYASSLRGFSVAAPDYLPPGYVLTEVDLSAKPAPPIQEHPTAFFTIRSGSAVLRMTVTYAGFIVDYVGTVIARPTADSSVVKHAGRNGDSYVLITPTQVIDLTTSAANQLTDVEAARILASVPRNRVDREWRADACPASLEACELGKSAAVAIQAGDAQALLKLAAATTLQCNQDSAPATQPLCQSGSEQTGYLTATAKSFGFVAGADFTTFIAASFESHDKVAVAAIGCPGAAGGQLDCSQLVLISVAPLDDDSRIASGNNAPLVLVALRNEAGALRIVAAQRTAADKPSFRGGPDTFAQFGVAWTGPVSFVPVRLPN